MFLIQNQQNQHLVKVQDLLTDKISYTWLSDNQWLQMQSYHNKHFTFVKAHSRAKLIKKLANNWQTMHIDPQQTYTIVKHSII